MTGEPTHAVFGFTAMLLKLLSQRPDISRWWSMPRKTFREERTPDYKANRAPAPDDLCAQIPRVLELVQRFGIPVISAQAWRR